MYPCEKCGLPRDGKSQFDNSGQPHDCIGALQAKVERPKQPYQRRKSSLRITTPTAAPKSEDDRRRP
jgi:hypothetical protein